MKSFLIIAIPLVLLSAAAVAAILQPLQSESVPAATIVNSKMPGQNGSDYVSQASLSTSRKTAKKTVACHLRCI